MATTENNRETNALPTLSGKGVFPRLSFCLISCRMCTPEPKGRTGRRELLPCPTAGGCIAREKTGRVSEHKSVSHGYN